MTLLGSAAHATETSTIDRLLMRIVDQRYGFGGLNCLAED